MGVRPNSRVLIVDDMRVNRMILSSLLSSNGITADLAGGGAECVELCRKNRYDLILLDHRMPDQDGIDTLAQLKEIFKERGEDVPVVCHTTDYAQKNISLYKAAGFSDVLIKPIDPREVTRILMTYLPEGKNKAIDSSDEGENSRHQKELDRLPGWLRELSEREGPSCLDLLAGIDNCDSAEFYLDALSVFASSITERAAGIEDALKSGDKKLFLKRLHAVKSMARLVGADRLSELADTLEEESQKGTDTASDAGKLLDCYREYLALLTPLTAGNDR